VQDQYSIIPFGICSGLFFGLGCVVLTKQTIQAPNEEDYPPLVSPEDDESTDDILDD
jgi:hypothetical protein